LDPNPVQITILADNQAEPGLAAEHGFSLWIEAQGKRILFDTGQGTALEPNVGALGLNLGETGILVISHGHYDHTGAIPFVLKNAGHVEVYGHPGVVLPRYAIRKGVSKPIGMPGASKAAIDSLPGKRMHWVSQPVMLSESIGLTGPIPRETAYEDVGGPFFLDAEGKQADLLEDDLALWFRTDEGLVVCVGCCHAGLVNTLNYVRRLEKGAAIRAVIGGFHLHSADNRRLELTLAAVKALKPERVIPCHCTGEAAVSTLKNALGECVTPGAAGTLWRF
jgi:7,8-dihydropterin-6-yl-methyl-4-(beta-D-ribofuranosyl)aminobenzene 5'-phosphate synthase